MTQINPAIPLLEETFGKGSVSGVVDTASSIGYLRVLVDNTCPVYFTYGSAEENTIEWQEGLDVLITGMLFPNGAEDIAIIEGNVSKDNHPRAIVRVYDRLREIYPDQDFHFFAPDLGQVWPAERIVENIRSDVE